MATFLETCRTWLQGVSMLAASCWVGGAMALWLLATAGDGLGGVATEVEAVYGANRVIGPARMAAMVVLGAAGCLITGLLYGLFVLWGGVLRGWLHFRDRHRQAAIRHA
ncbi:hypothetical protein [Desulfolutivibrio sp.]|uniref:hypothetical protein n=1 Tax=Desulfolutivibrio sp. TaxID=2773296 RepID=UPI002F9647C7